MESSNTVVGLRQPLQWQTFQVDNRKSPDENAAPKASVIAAIIHKRCGRTSNLIYNGVPLKLM